MSIKSLKIMDKPNCHMRSNRGFTLIEALLGFLILSIGMLGVASLQAISLKSGKTAVYGSVAMMKVDELLESMRANNTAVALTAYAAAGDGANNGCSTGTTCSDLQLAQDDVFWWKQNLAAGLPGAVTTVITLTPAAAPSRMATVTIDINWAERNQDASGSVDRTYTTTANICTAIPC